MDNNIRYVIARFFAASFHVIAILLMGLAFYQFVGIEPFNPRAMDRLQDLGIRSGRSVKIRIGVQKERDAFFKNGAIR